MQQTFANLPQKIEEAVEQILSQKDNAVWDATSEELHNRYIQREKGQNNSYIDNYSDALAYLALRLPATYAQIVGALRQVQEVLPSWKPQTLLDIGAGPGTGILATQAIWSTVASATCLDGNEDLLNLGKTILSHSQMPTKIVWQQGDIRNEIKEDKTYDIVLLANVLNELRTNEVEKVIEEAYRVCSGVLVIIEPGTAFGNTLITSISKKISDSGLLIAPYIDNSFMADKDTWIHFPQRFIRPAFQRRLRQQMRESSLMASDWEEAKYCYVAISKIPSENNAWGRVIGPVKKMKGFLEVPVLTKDAIIHKKVMKRDKTNYSFTKNLQWGQLISHEEHV